ncbi:MAG TPA: SRPBCC family protein [Solirubrobacterales bacterium]|nr:SRPBCC family protein [Solirubrobacterales bacterium]
MTEGTERSEKADPAGINEQAPIRGEGEIEVAAQPKVVWDVLSGLERWPEWNPDVKSMSVRGPLAPGSVFRWKAGPGTITSTLLRVEPPRLIAWRGNTLGIKAIHFWWLRPRDGNTFVRTAESYDGLVARLLRRPIQRALDDGLDGGLRHLKAEAERRATAAEQD